MHDPARVVLQVKVGELAPTFAFRFVSLGQSFDEFSVFFGIEAEFEHAHQVGVVLS